MPSLPSFFTPVPDLLSLVFPLRVNKLSSVLTIVNSDYFHYIYKEFQIVFYNQYENKEMGSYV